MKNKGREHIHQPLEAKIIWETQLPIGVKPSYVSSGGYEALGKDGRSIYFDWSRYEADAEVLPNGVVRMTMYHRDFNYEFCMEQTCSNLHVDFCEDTNELAMQIASILSESQLKVAALDIVFHVLEQEVPIRMKLIDMTISCNGITHSFDVTNVQVEQVGGIYVAI